MFKEQFGVSFNTLASHIGYFFPRPKYRFNIEQVKNVDKSLLYVSKCDKDLLTNFSTSKMSKWYQFVEYCRKTDRINFTGPIIFNSKCNLNYIQQFHNEIQASLSLWKGYKIQAIETFCTTCPWVKELIDAYNCNIKCCDKKPKHIYLYGDANCGKTSIIEQIIGETNLEKRTLIVNNYSTPFFFQNYIHGSHHYIMLDEFQYEYFLDANINVLKKALERNSRFAISKKFQKEEYVTVNGPVFFLSNYPLPKYADQAFKSRLTIIHATCPYYACNTHILPNELLTKKAELQKEKLNKDKVARERYFTTHRNEKYTEHCPELNLNDRDFIKNNFPIANNNIEKPSISRQLLIPHNLNIENEQE